MVDYSYVVTHDPSGGNTNITTDIEEVHVVDTGTGEIKSCKIKLDCRFGKFLTAAPILAQFEQVNVKITDEDSNVYEQIFEIDRIIPIKNAGEGYSCEVEMLGQEHYLQKIDVMKQFEQASATTVSKDLIDFYNDINGSSQPEIQNHDTFTSGNNELPQWTANDYDFALSEIKVYDALMEVVEGLGASVAAAGAADFFELYFDSNLADITKLNFKAFSSGGDPGHPNAGSEVTITDSNAVNVAPTEGGIDSITGTLIKAWGKKGSGTLPQSVESFNGELFAFLLTPDHIVGVTYPSGARVQIAGVVYQANTETSTTPPGAAWDITTFDAVRGVTGYSEWTENREYEWRSSGTDPSDTQKGLGCFDSNMVVNDGARAMSWCHLKSTTDNFDVNYKYGAASGGVYRGLRALVNGTGINGFTGNDDFGKAFTNNLAQYDGARWVVIKVFVNNERCAIRNEGRVYELQSGTWTDISGDDRENHCFHIVHEIQNINGYNSTSDGSGTYGDGSAVEWHWQYTALDTFPTVFFTTDGFYQIGAWANWSVPFPENSYNGNTLGALYGNDSTKKEPATIDINGMHLDRDGNVGFNSTNSKDHGPMDGVQFWIKFNWTDLIPAQALQGDFKMRFFMYDTSDNVVIQDFVIPFNNQWKQINLPFSGFTNYRARVPRTNQNFAITLFTNDLEILNVFQWRNIKLMGVQWQEVYDEEGRFHPNLFSKAITGVAAGISDIRLAIDEFCFTKPLLAITPTVSTRPIEPPAMQFPDIFNSVQLDQIVNAQLELEQFQHEEWTTITAGRIDIPFGDTYFLVDSTLINSADTRTADSGGNANTKRLVAKRIRYDITKPSSTGGGSFLRTITGIKRFVT